jgi:uncharacterized membrane protein (UPF0182 family)
LTRVVVSDGTRIAMEPTLREAIDALLDPKRSQAAEAPTPGGVPSSLPPAATP